MSSGIQLREGRAKYMNWLASFPPPLVGESPLKWKEDFNLPLEASLEPHWWVWSSFNWGEWTTVWEHIYPFSVRRKTRWFGVLQVHQSAIIFQLSWTSFVFQNFLGQQIYALPVICRTCVDARLPWQWQHPQWISSPLLFVSSQPRLHTIHSVLDDLDSAHKTQCNHLDRGA